MMLDFNNFTTEQQAKVSLITGNVIMRGLQATSITLSVGSIALKNIASVIRTGAEVITMAGNNVDAVGDIVHENSKKAAEKAKEYEEGLEFCEQLINEGKLREVA